MNAGMSEYNKTLQEMYGIFATNTSSEDLEKALANYFAKTIEGSIGTNNMTEKEYIQNFSKKDAKKQSEVVEKKLDYTKTLDDMMVYNKT